MKPIKTEVVFTTPWFEVVGKTMRAEEDPYYSLRLPEYVAVVATTEDERVLLVRQYRPAIEQYTLELPSGLVDPGEDFAETARRELLEETGYAGSVEPLGRLFVDSGRLNNRIWSFRAKDVRAVEGFLPEPGIEVLTYSYDDLWQAIRDGSFALSHHVGILMQAVLSGTLSLA
jgi:ADP-ribose pyrophosphatase